MEELSKELTKRMAKDLRTAKTYHVGKKSFIKLAKDYCEYELPKMKDIAFTQYQGTYWLDFINDEYYRVPWIKRGDDIRFEFGVIQMILIR